MTLFRPFYRLVRNKLSVGNPVCVSGVHWKRFAFRSMASPLSGVFAIMLIGGTASIAIAQETPQTSRSPRQARGFTPTPTETTVGRLDTSQPIEITPQQIIDRFAAKESQFKIALENYTYRRTVKFDTLDREGNVDGEYLRIADILFSTSGQKREKTVYAPDDTLSRVALSPADFDDIEHRFPFTLTTENIRQYLVTYVGKQSIDQIETYVFDVKPKQLENGHRYFSGRIWVDAHDFQIVVTDGKNIPDDTRRGQEDLSLPFTTYRQQIDGKYWFPVYTRAEGILHFKNCKECLPNDVHLKEIVKYGDYKRFGTEFHILYNGVDIADEKPLPASIASPSGGPQTASARPAGNPVPTSGAIHTSTTKE